MFCVITVYETFTWVFFWTNNSLTLLSMVCTHDLEVVGLNPGQVELVLSSPGKVRLEYTQERSAPTPFPPPSGLPQKKSS